MSHTPGPWISSLYGHNVLTSDSRHSIAQVHTPKREFAFTPLDVEEARNHNERVANARLIAAAPDLLAACGLGLELLDTLREDGIGNHLTPGVKDLYRGISEQMLDAIARAKGDQ